MGEEARGPASPAGQAGVPLCPACCLPTATRPQVSWPRLEDKGLPSLFSLQARRWPCWHEDSSLGGHGFLPGPQCSGQRGHL